MYPFLSWMWNAAEWPAASIDDFVQGLLLPISALAYLPGLFAFASSFLAPPDKQVKCVSIVDLTAILNDHYAFVCCISSH